MAVLNRKLFNRGGPVSSRGVGITSGLVPVQKFQEGGKVSRLGALSPALLDFGGRLLASKSLQGGVTGGLDILGQSLSGSAPSFAEGLKTYRAGQEEDTDRQIEKDAEGYQRYVDTGERVFPDAVLPVKEEKPQYDIVKPGESLYKDGKLVVERMNVEKDKKLYKLAPNVILYGEDGSEVARGMDKADTEVYKLNPGQKIFDKGGKVIAFYEKPDDSIIKLNPGQKAFDIDGNLLFESPALAKEEKTFKLSQGQKAFDAAGNEIASVAPKETRPIDTSITVSAGSKVINKETGEVIFDNPSNQDQTKIYKAQPGSTLVNEAGEVIYKAPEKKEYFKLKEGESIYDEKGEVIATGTSTVANIDTYRDFATAEERQQFLVNTLSKKAGFDTDGRVMIENLPFDEQQRLELAMQSVDLIYKQQVENWGDTQKEYLATISDVYTLETQLDQAEENLMNETELVATGPVTGRITPLFGVFENLTGLSLPTIFNNVLGKNVLLTTLQKDEINRLQNQIAISFQKQMKGQVNTFEAKQIVQSMFNVNKLPGSNKVAIDNMRFINDMNKAMIDISQNSKTYAEFSRGVQQWKKNNKLPQLIPEAEKKQNIKDEYGLTDEEAGITG
jgi:hypothetical protein